jgi:hypothetical protein
MWSYARRSRPLSHKRSLAGEPDNRRLAGRGADIESPGSATRLTKSEAVQQHAASSVRLVEVLGTLSLAIDLNVGQSMEHVLRSAILAVRLADAVGLDEVALTNCY